VYALAALETGREAGVALAERWVLTPLWTAAILALLGLVWALGRAARPAHPRDDRRDMAAAPPARPLIGVLIARAGSTRQRRSRPT
jgi:hypothetical protein